MTRNLSTHQKKTMAKYGLTSCSDHVQLIDRLINITFCAQFTN